MASRTRTVPRKLPQQERSRATIDAILTATARILVKEGFDRASTNRIAETAGVSVGSLYQYFPSKEALVAALVEQHMEEMSAEITRAFARVVSLPPPQAARQMVDLMLNAHAINPALHKVLNEQVPRVGRLDRLREVEARALQLVRGYLEAHRDELQVKNLEVAAFVVVTMVEAITHAAAIHHPGKMRERALADEVTAAVVRYLTKA